jgi:shikimate kinase
MPLQQHIVFIGPMGAGKSTIGRLLSEQLEVVFLDLDKEIEDRSGATIPWIFDIEGEGGFREREMSVLQAIVEEAPLVLATGGGCVLKSENREVLSAAGDVVYLSTSVEQQLIRTAKDKNRPLLQTDNPQQVLMNMAEIRNPLYEQIADITIDTNGKPPKYVVHEIIQFLQKR